MFPSLPSGYFRPRRLRPGGIGNWTGHLPFACDLISEARPGLLVELGTHYGESYFGFCQAIEQSDAGCLAYAVDSWRGDVHAGEYGEEVFTEVSEHNRALYSSFSTLLRMTFDEALSSFSDATIDLLHIDGLHTYEAAARDFDNWLPKVRQGGLILLHDTAEREREFGVWRLWEEVRDRFPSFEFHHSHGLGVLAKADPGSFDSPLLSALFSNPSGSQSVRDYYSGCAERLRCGIGIEEPNGLCQVFFPENRMYSEEKSVISPFQPRVWVRFTFEGMADGLCRIDPVDSAGIVEITGLTIEDCPSGTILWTPDSGQSELVSCRGTSLRLRDQGRLLALSYGADPQIYLPEVEKSHVRISFWMRFDPDFSAAARLLAEHAQGAFEITELTRALSEANSERARLAGQVELLRAQCEELKERTEQIERERDSLAGQLEPGGAEGDELAQRTSFSV